jgi:F-type H+-transporting ATPase subunit b
VKKIRIALKASLSALILAFLLIGFTPKAIAMQEAPAATQAGDHAQAGHTSEKQEQKAEEDESDAYRHSPMVKAIGAKLGMDPEHASTVFTALNLAVLVLLVGWFLVKTLPKTFRNRSEALQKHLVEAKKASEEASTRLDSVETRLGKLDEQIAAMRAQAEKDAQADEQRMKASVEEEKQKILSSAEQEIAAATTQARRQIQQYAADLAIDQAAKKLVVTAETDRLLVQEFARRLGSDAEGGRN